MIVDSLGNPLKVGEWVVTMEGDQTLACQIMEIEEPSVLAPGPNQMTRPGIVRLLPLPLMKFYDQKNPRLQGVIKIYKPANSDQRGS